mgnify:CR=1 FL=1
MEQGLMSLFKKDPQGMIRVYRGEPRKLPDRSFGYSGDMEFQKQEGKTTRGKFFTPNLEKAKGFAGLQETPSVKQIKQTGGGRIKTMLVSPDEFSKAAKDAFKFHAYGMKENRIGGPQAAERMLKDGLRYVDSLDLERAIGNINDKQYFRMLREGIFQFAPERAKTAIVESFKINPGGMILEGLGVAGKAVAKGAGVLSYPLALLFSPELNLDEVEEGAFTEYEELPPEAMTLDAT